MGTRLEIHHLGLAKAGDATLILQRDGTDVTWSILIDGGGAADAARVARYLHAQKVQTLTSVVATHFDDDHVSGLAVLIAAGTCIGPNTKVYDRGAPRFSAGYAPPNKRARVVIGEKRKRPAQSYEPTSLKAGAASYLREVPCIHDATPDISPLAPTRPTMAVLGWCGAEVTPAMTFVQRLSDGTTGFQPPTWLVTTQPSLTGSAGPIAVRVVAANGVAPNVTLDGLVDLGGTESNRGSLAIVVEWGGIRYFVGGDLEKAEEKTLTTTGYLANKTVDILKLSHHGGKHSSKQGFLAAVQPTVAIASNGINNRHGHPAQKTLLRLEKTSWTSWHGTQLSSHLARYFCTGWFYSDVLKKHDPFSGDPASPLRRALPRLQIAGAASPIPASGGVVAVVEPDGAAAVPPYFEIHWRDAFLGAPMSAGAVFTCYRATTPVAPSLAALPPPPPPPGPAPTTLPALAQALQVLFATAAPTLIATSIPGSSLAAWIAALPAQAIALTAPTGPTSNATSVAFSAGVATPWQSGAGGGALSQIALQVTITQPEPGGAFETEVAVTGSWCPGAAFAWPVTGALDATGATVALSAGAQADALIDDLRAAWSSQVSSFAAEGAVLGALASALPISAVAITLGATACATTVSLGVGDLDVLGLVSLSSAAVELTCTASGTPAIVELTAALTATLGAGAPFAGSSATLVFSGPEVWSLVVDLVGFDLTTAAKELGAWCNTTTDPTQFLTSLGVGVPDVQVTQFTASLDVAGNASLSGSLTLAVAWLGATIDATLDASLGAAFALSLTLAMELDSGGSGYVAIPVGAAFDALGKLVDLDLAIDAAADLDLDAFQLTLGTGAIAFAVTVGTATALTFGGIALPPATLALSASHDATGTTAAASLVLAPVGGPTLDAAVHYTTDDGWTLSLEVASLTLASAITALAAIVPGLPSVTVPALPVDFTIVSASASVHLGTLAFSLAADCTASLDASLALAKSTQLAAVVSFYLGAEQAGARPWGVAVTLPWTIGPVSLQVSVQAGTGVDTTVEIYATDTTTTNVPADIASAFGVTLSASVATALAKVLPTMRGIAATFDLTSMSVAIGALADLPEGVGLDVLFAIVRADGNTDVIAGFGVTDLALTDLTIVKDQLPDLGFVQLAAAAVLVSTSSLNGVTLPPLPLVDAADDPFAQLGALTFQLGDPDAPELIVAATLDFGAAIASGQSGTTSSARAMRRLDQLCGSSLGQIPASVQLIGAVSMSESDPAVALSIDLQCSVDLTGKSKGAAVPLAMAQAQVLLEWSSAGGAVIELSGSIELDIHGHELDITGGLALTQDEIEAFFFGSVAPPFVFPGITLSLTEVGIELGVSFGEDVTFDVGFLCVLAEGTNAYTLAGQGGIEAGDPPLPSFDALVLGATSLQFSDLLGLLAPPIPLPSEASTLLDRASLSDTYLAIINASDGSIVLPDGTTATSGFTAYTALDLYGFEAFVSVAITSSVAKATIQCSPIHWGPVNLTGKANAITVNSYQLVLPDGKTRVFPYVPNEKVPAASTLVQTPVVTAGGAVISVDTSAAPYVSASMDVVILGVDAPPLGQLFQSALSFSFAYAVKGRDHDDAIGVTLACSLEDGTFSASGTGFIKPGNIIPDAGKILPDGHVEIAITVSDKAAPSVSFHVSVGVFSIDLSGSDIENPSNVFDALKHWIEKHL